MLTGVIRELGRTRCFLVKETGVRDKPVDQNVLALLSSFPLNNESANSAEDHEQEEAYKVLGDERGAKEPEKNIW